MSHVWNISFATELNTKRIPEKRQDCIFAPKRVKKAACQSQTGLLGSIFSTIPSTNKVTIVSEPSSNPSPKGNLIEQHNTIRC